MHAPCLLVVDCDTPSAPFVRSPLAQHHFVLFRLADVFVRGGPSRVSPVLPAALIVCLDICFACCVGCFVCRAGGVRAHVGGARVGDADSCPVDEEDSSGRGRTQLDSTSVLRVVSREEGVRQGAHLQGHRVSRIFLGKFLCVGPFWGTWLTR